ncbi:MAG: hypothetical protein JNL88_10710 [Bacteroidia bacterium]|nr:hypothetical protein [Bacteroidia bacterium]
MIKTNLKDHLLTGFAEGLLAMTLLYVLLKKADQFVLRHWDRPLFIQAESIQLIILSLILVLMRWHFVSRRETETGKGLFLSIFLSAMLYLYNRKYHFITL